MRGLSLEDGLSTLTDFTTFIICDLIIKELNLIEDNVLKILVCGGGRKNLLLFDKIKEKLPNNIKVNLIDDYKIDGMQLTPKLVKSLMHRKVIKISSGGVHNICIVEP